MRNQKNQEDILRTRPAGQGQPTSWGIWAQGLSLRYRRGGMALQDVSLRVRRGEGCGLLGPNGAGKSTLLKLLSGRLRPDGGDLWVLGRDMRTQGRAARAQLGCVAQGVSLDSAFTLPENLIWQGRLYGLKRAQARARAEELIDAFGLGDCLARPVALYSGGLRRRMDIAAQLMPSPRLLLLDEPAAGLDIQARQELWLLLKKLWQREALTLLVATHSLEEAQALGDILCILGEGNTLFQGTPEQLRRAQGQEDLRRAFWELAGAPDQGVCPPERGKTEPV